MVSLYPDLPDAIKNTNKIAEMCNLEIEIGKWFFPNLNFLQRLLPKNTLKLTYQNAQEYFGKLTPEIKERLNYELSVICPKGYSLTFNYERFYRVVRAKRYPHQHPGFSFRLTRLFCSGYYFS